MQTRRNILWYQETNGDLRTKQIIITENADTLLLRKTRQNESVEEYHLQKENAQSDGECRHGNGDIARDDLT